MGLKTCPFCGGEPLVHENDWCEPPEFSVHCESCIASTLGSADRMQAIAAWNRRTTGDEND
jgi:Lar family restriction alleviation protein